MPINKATQALFNRFAYEDGILPRGAILVGGTALALLLDHRDSEDLDFAFVGTTLPTAEVKDCIRKLRETSEVHKLEVSDWEKADWDDHLQEIDDYQQTYTIDGIKVQFFIPEYANELLNDAPNRNRRGNISIATARELLDLKSIILEEQVRQRDVFDLYWLITKGGKTFADVKAAFDRAKSRNFDTGISRLLNGKFKKTDPGYHQIVGDAKPIEELREELKVVYDNWEKKYAAQKMAALPLPHGPNPR